MDGCERAYYAKGFCSKHYRIWHKFGDPLEWRPSKGAAFKFMRGLIDCYRSPDCIRWPYTFRGKGYPAIVLDGRKQYVTRIICEAVHGPPETSNHQARHLCGNLDCCNPVHLEWGTQSDNEADKKKHGTVARLQGERHGLAKLTAAQVRRIRTLAGTKPQTEIAAMFGIAQQTVGCIIRRKTWHHIE